MEYTQEQIDKMLADAKAGLFTEEELAKRVTSEVDRRVESGIQKGLETKKTKWEQEFAEKAKLSAEELAKKEVEEKMTELTKKEKDILKKSNTLEAKDMLVTANIPKTHYEKFIDVLISEDDVSTKANVQNFIDMFNTTKTEIETKVKSELAHVKQPNGGDGDKPVTKESFNKMGYAEKMAFKTSNPEMFDKFIK